MSVVPSMIPVQVQTSDRLNTDPDSDLTVTLTDASKLELAEASVLVIDEHVLGPGGDRLSTKVSLVSGLVRSVVNLTTSGSPNFEVHTPNAVAAARDTDYAVGYEEGTGRPGYTGCNRFTDVAVYEGTVGLTQIGLPGAPEVEIRKGYETSVPCGMAPLTPGPLGMTGTTTVAPDEGGGGSAPRPGTPIGPLAPAPILPPPPRSAPPPAPPPPVFPRVP